MKHPYAIFGTAAHLPSLRIVHTYPTIEKARARLNKFQAAGERAERITLHKSVLALVQQWRGDGDTYTATATFVVIPTSLVPASKYT